MSNFGMLKQVSPLIKLALLAGVLAGTWLVMEHLYNNPAPGQLIDLMQNSANQSDIEYAIAHGAPVDACGESGITPLCNAALSGRVETMKFLIDHGANINAVTSNGFTPLMLAVLGDKPEAVKILLDHHADKNVRTTLGNLSALELAKNNSRQGCIELLNADTESHSGVK